MQSPAVVTIIKMLEALPEAAQDRVADHLREYIAELQDNAAWDELFAGSQDKLAAAARRAREEIAAGKASPLDHDAL